jgi:hypothetical protein
MNLTAVRGVRVGTVALAAGVSFLAGQGGAQAQSIVQSKVNAGTFTPVVRAPSNLGTFDIVIVPGAGLSGNAAALAAFNRAAAQWESRISDSIIVTVNANLTVLSPGVLGQTSSVSLSGSYTDVRGAMVADAANEADDAIVAALPAVGAFTLPVNFSYGGNMSANKANLKALNFAGLDGTFGASDGSISFNSNFTFDFDNDNGVSPGAIDFETVAAHEIGHLLGFVSDVDFVDQVASGTVLPNPLDLFRFDNDGVGQDPSTVGEFTTFPRSMVPGNDEITDEINTPELRMSTGVSKGDGRQASHWKDDALTGTYLGLMDPNLSTGQFVDVMPNDFRAIDLIGYEIDPIPEPAGLAVLALAAGALARRLRRR